MADIYRTLPEDAGATWVSDSKECSVDNLTNLRDPWGT
jgi:hypothetical protein